MPVGIRQALLTADKIALSPDIFYQAVVDEKGQGAPERHAADPHAGGQLRLRGELSSRGIDPFLDHPVQLVIDPDML